MLPSFLKQTPKTLILFCLLLFIPLCLFAQTGNGVPSIGPVRMEFILFALVLVGVALFHNKTMYVALIGLVCILVFKWIFDPGFSFMHHLVGDGEMSQQIIHKELRNGEWSVLLNLLGLLFGFGILARIFQESKVPDALPSILPSGWKGGLVLLVLIFVMSSFLDNIAAAIIGGTIAMVVYKGKVHLGFLAAIVAASNAGGSGSVVGDTTTTLMWIDGVSPVDVLHAYIGAAVALVIFGFFAAKQQNKYAQIQPSGQKVKIKWDKIIAVILILVLTIAANYFFDFPALGVWVGILISACFTKVDFGEMKHSWQGTIFLMCLVTAASLMPVNDLPPASMWTAFALGLVSAVFDNIPLTKLCLEQGGYDWGVLAYAVGFGGSMLWFGSSAGVALSNMFPEARNTVNYVRKGWHVPVAYVVGFFALVGIFGWHPHAPHKKHKHTQQTEEKAEAADIVTPPSKATCFIGE